MTVRFRRAAAAALFLPLLLSGCRFTTRRLPIPKAPSIEQTVSPEALVARLNRRWEALRTLTAKVDVQASELKTKEGLAKDYTSFPAIIMIRKPEMLRVYARIPVIGTCLFDLASDGKTFTLLVPRRNNKVIQGSNTLKTKSASQMENMRPGFFLDAMTVRGLEPDDLYSVTADTVTVEDAVRKHIYSVPRYILSISRRNPDSQRLAPVRVVYFHRDDLLPYQQDVYDSEGNLETQVVYSGYRDFGAGKYPSAVTIVRPLEEYRINLAVNDVKENQPLSDDQFVVKIPDGAAIQKLE